MEMNNSSFLHLKYDKGLHMTRVRLEFDAMDYVTQIVRTVSIVLVSAVAQAWEASKETGIVQTLVENAGGSSAVGILLVQSCCLFLNSQEEITFVKQQVAAIPSEEGSNESEFPVKKYNVKNEPCYTVSRFFDLSYDQKVVNLNPSESKTVNLGVQVNVPNWGGTANCDITIIDAYSGSVLDSIETTFQIKVLEKTSLEQDGLSANDSSRSKGSNSDTSKKGLSWTWWAVIIAVSTIVVGLGAYCVWKKFKKPSSQTKKTKKSGKKRKIRGERTFLLKK
eukprot:GDKJ01020172.1.p1 GENE.GDKJ01020172.1~~GDKJ01020172.1.p1  ORF type:complete len:327 (-),score=50.77 GDKJ01020172.1:41-877(-)